MPPNTGDKVIYRRVSREKQGKSGLGLEAQLETVHNFLDGGDWEIIGDFIEVETGRVSDRHRPELRKALQLCKDKGATLVVARLDRLTRNVYFLNQLLDSGVPFVACDIPEFGNPATNRFVLNMMANMAEYEAARISSNTKLALAAAKRRGQKLGNPRAAGTGKKRKAKQQAKKVADDFACYAGPVIDELEKYGCDTLKKIAEGLKARGVKSMRGKTDWSLSSVRNVRIRFNKCRLS
jgi:DNA invertase Pin-like site-specific DNA recombinase